MVCEQQNRYNNFIYYNGLYWKCFGIDCKNVTFRINYKNSLTSVDNKNVTWLSRYSKRV